MRYLLGGYDAASRGIGEGIGALTATEDGELTAEPDAVAVAGSPSWLAWHPELPVLYATLEGSGALAAFDRAPSGALSLRGAPLPIGELPCHAAAAPDGSALLASCWGDGRLARVGLRADGGFGTVTFAPAVLDPYAPASGETAAPSRSGADVAAREALRAVVGEEYASLLGAPDDADAPEADDVPTPERVSRAHEARFLPRSRAVTTDMGLDTLRFWDVFPEGLRHRQSLALPKGSGPRHTVWHPSGHLYLLTELSRELFVLRPDADGTWRILSSTPVAPDGLDTDTAAELALSADGRFVYAGLRGSDTIGVASVRGDGDRLAPAGLVESGVEKPRYHRVDGDRLLIAGQKSNDVVSRNLDPRTGIPGSVRGRATAASPSHILPDRVG